MASWCFLMARPSCSMIHGALPHGVPFADPSPPSYAKKRDTFVCVQNRKNCTQTKGVSCTQTKDCTQTKGIVLGQLFLWISSILSPKLIAYETHYDCHSRFFQETSCIFATCFLRPILHNGYSKCTHGQLLVGDL